MADIHLVDDFAVAIHQAALCHHGFDPGSVLDAECQAQATHLLDCLRPERLTAMEDHDSEPRDVYVLGWAQDLNDWGVYAVYATHEAAMAAADAFVATIHSTLLMRLKPDKLFASSALGGYGHDEGGICCRPTSRKATLHA